MVLRGRRHEFLLENRQHSRWRWIAAGQGSCSRSRLGFKSKRQSAPPLTSRA